MCKLCKCILSIEKKEYLSSVVILRWILNWNNTLYELIMKYLSTFIVEYIWKWFLNIFFFHQKLNFIAVRIRHQFWFILYYQNIIIPKVNLSVKVATFIFLFLLLFDRIKFLGKNNCKNNGKLSLYCRETKCRNVLIYHPFITMKYLATTLFSVSFFICDLFLLSLFLINRYFMNR